MKHPALSPAPANPTGSKIILHQRRAAALTHLMLLVRLGQSIFSRAPSGSETEPAEQKGAK